MITIFLKSTKYQGAHGSIFQEPPYVFKKIRNDTSKISLKYNSDILGRYIIFIVKGTEKNPRSITALAGFSQSQNIEYGNEDIVFYFIQPPT